MKQAEEKKKLVKAYRLGAATATEEELIREGAIRRLADGSYELFSQEAVNGAGEIARAGDHFKVDTVDGKWYPYPNSGRFFEANHRHLEGDSYEQRGLMPMRRFLYPEKAPAVKRGRGTGTLGQMGLRPCRPQADGPPG